MRRRVHPVYRLGLVNVGHGTAADGVGTIRSRAPDWRGSTQRDDVKPRSSASWAICASTLPIILPVQVAAAPRLPPVGKMGKIK